MAPTQSSAVQSERSPYVASIMSRSSTSTIPLPLKSSGMPSPWLPNAARRSSRSSTPTTPSVLRSIGKHWSVPCAAARPMVLRREAQRARDESMMLTAWALLCLALPCLRSKGRRVRLRAVIISA